MTSLTHRMRVLRHLEQQQAALKARTFPTPHDFFEAVLGPRQHDAHVQHYRSEQWLDHKTAEYAQRSANAAQVCAEMCAEARARRRGV